MITIRLTDDEAMITTAALRNHFWSQDVPDDHSLIAANVMAHIEQQAGMDTVEDDF